MEKEEFIHPLPEQAQYHGYGIQRTAGSQMCCHQL